MDDKPNVIESTVLNLIARFKENDLDYAVKNNIRLVELIVQFLPPMLTKTIRMSSALYRNQSNLLTTENILRWLDISRPDFARAIRQSQERKRWLEKQIHDIKRYFL